MFKSILILLLLIFSFVNVSYASPLTYANVGFNTLGTCAEHAEAGLNPCMNGGTCVTNDHEYYFHPSWEQYDENRDINLSGYIGLKCDCPSGFYGNWCGRTTPDDALVHTFVFDNNARYLDKAYDNGGNYLRTETHSFYALDAPASFGQMKMVG